MMEKGIFFFLRFSGHDSEEMYIHFMAIRTGEKRTFTAGDLAPVPIGFKAIACPSQDHLNPC